MLVAYLAQGLQQLGGRLVKSALALDRLHDDCRDPARLDVRTEQEVQRLQALGDCHVVMRDREWHVVDLGRKRPEAALVGQRLAGERAGHDRAPMEATCKRDDSASSGGSAGDLDAVLDCFCTGGEEDRACRALERRQRIQPLRQFDIGLVGEHLHAGMGEPAHLLGRGGDDLGVAVPGVQHRDATCEIDVAAAFDVPDLGIARVVGIHAGRVRQRAGDGGSAACEQGRVRRRLGLQGGVPVNDGWYCGCHTTMRVFWR